MAIRSPFSMRDRIRFSHLLPLIDLALLVALVFVPITLTALRLYQAANGANSVHLHAGELDANLPRSQIIPWAIRIATVPRAPLIMAINLPGVLLQAFISLLANTSPPSAWHPQALALETWQALVFPFFALPFWWLVGCGLDALVDKERLHWALLLAGTVLFFLCLVGVIVFCFPMPNSDRANLLLQMKGIIGWTVGFAVMPIAWIVQSMRKRHNREAAA